MNFPNKMQHFVHSREGDPILFTEKIVSEFVINYLINSLNRDSDSTKIAIWLTINNQYLNRDNALYLNSRFNYCLTIYF